MEAHYGRQELKREFLYIPGKLLVYSCIVPPYFLYKIMGDRQRLDQLETMVKEDKLQYLDDTFVLTGRNGFLRQPLDWILRTVEVPDRMLNGFSYDGNEGSCRRAEEIFDEIISSNGLLQKRGQNENKI
jgi:hypothetical protein